MGKEQGEGERRNEAKSHDNNANLRTYERRRLKNEAERIAFVREASLRLELGLGLGPGLQWETAWTGRVCGECYYKSIIICG